MQEAEDVTEGDVLDHSEASKYRHLAATVTYLSMDRSDVQFAASVLGRAGVAAPQSKVWWQRNEWHGIC